MNRLSLAALGACLAFNVAAQEAASPAKVPPPEQKQPVQPAQAPAVPAQPPGPPKAPVRVVTDTYHGETIADPYRWLEDYQTPEAKEWVRAQDEWTRKELAKLPAREHYIKRLAQLEAIPTETVTGYSQLAPMLLKNGSVFFLKRKAGEAQGKLYMRASRGGADRVLYDPMAGRDAGSKPRALAWFSPSPDGKHVAMGVAEGGSERADLYVLQVANAKIVDGPISRTDWATPSWLPDGKGFFYSRLAADKSEADRYSDSQAHFHRIGSSGEDPVVFGNQQATTRSIDKLHFPFVFVDPAGKLLYGFVTRGTERPFALYVAKTTEWRAGRLKWTPVFGFDAGFETPEPDEFAPLALRDKRLLLVTHKGNPDGTVVALNPLNPAEASVIYSAKGVPITYFTLAKDGMYLRLQDGPVGRVLRLEPRTKRTTPVAFPVEGTANFAQTNTEAEGIAVLTGSWTAPSEWQYIAKGATRSQPLPLADTKALLAVANLASETVMVPSHDGVKVPMSIVYPKGFKKDGTAPAYVHGYGGYGLVDSPFFSRNWVALAERGFVNAVCHVRGSGAYGERWHKAGFKATKPNTWKDFIACAEYLGKNGYASPKRIAGTGTSAGGILIGRAVTERPDLFSAAVLRVGLLDALRFEMTANGKANIPELGTVAKPDEYKWLKAMSTYAAITDGAKYPALLLTHGFNDPRVPVWATTKSAARFQAATQSGRPVFLRVEMDAGHGVGSSTKQREIENADTFAFLEEFLK